MNFLKIFMKIKSFMRSLLGLKICSNNNQTNEVVIQDTINYGKIACRDFYEAQSKPGWIEQRKAVDAILHYFKIFFSPG